METDFRGLRVAASDGSLLKGTETELSDAILKMDTACATMRSYWLLLINGLDTCRNSVARVAP